MTENLKIQSFENHEEIFKQRTGNDFTFFYKKYYPKLIYYTSKFCNNSQKAEDVTTESFITAFEKIEKYEKEKAQFSTWLFTIARNLLLQDIKNTKKVTSLDNELDDEGTTLKDFLQEEDDNSNTNFVSDRKAEIMINHMSSLKEPYRRVIEMRELKNMAYKNIACAEGKDVEFEIKVSNGETLLPMEISKVYYIKDKLGNSVEDYQLIEGNTTRTPFFTKLSIKPGEYHFSGRTPKSL